MSSHPYDLVVIGGGPAGVTAALRGRELGATVALVERGPMGGTCTNDGCVPTRVLARAARLVRDAQQFEAYGLSGAPPTVDLPLLLARTRGIVQSVREKKDLERHLRSTGVDVRADAGAARFVDPHTLALPDGDHLEGRRFLIAAGGHARRLPLPGAEWSLTHSDVWTMSALPRSMAIVGGAATGCQIASVFAAFGTQVTLLELSPRILSGEEPEVSQAMAESFSRRGITIEAGLDGVDGVERRSSGRLALRYRDEGQEQEVEADAVLFAVGWVGNVDDLGLDAAGVEVERSYVKVDDTLRTVQPHIYAAGDITGRVMLVQTAGFDALLAVENALLGGDERDQRSIVPHGGFTDPEYASVGQTEAAARAERGEDVIAAMVPYAELDRAVIDGHMEGFAKLVVERSSRRLLGAHVVGEQAVEVVQLVAAGMTSGMTVEQLAGLELAYPTFTAILGSAARQIVRELGAVPVSPVWRALGQHRLVEWERRSA